MKKNTLVRWITSKGVHGSGVTISDESEGHVQVAADEGDGEPHPVIYCAVTWLTVVPS